MESLVHGVGQTNPRAEHTAGSGCSCCRYERNQGIGLGLAFVDAVAKRHSGYVDVESNIGEGSTFCLIIPRVETTDEVDTA